MENVERRTPCFVAYEYITSRKKHRRIRRSSRPSPIGMRSKRPKKKKKEAMTKTTENASVVPGKGGIHLRGSDADKDGKTGEGKKKIKDFSDRNGNGTPDAFERSSSSEYDSEYESTSEDEKSQGNGMAKKRANASAIEDEDGGACVSPKALAKKARAIADAVKATLSNSDGRVHVA